MDNIKKSYKYKKLSNKNILLGTMATVLCAVPISVGVNSNFKKLSKCFL